MYPQPFQPYQAQQQVIRVTGENGARAYNIGPNSSVLLLDETAPLIWLVQTDGAGYKSLSPYKIEPYKPEPIPDISALIERIDKLERSIHESYTSNDNRESGEQPNKSAKKC